MALEKNWNLPNSLTILRVLLTPGFVLAFIKGQVEIAWGLFALAGLTDALDGFLARVLKQRTTLGAMLDPLADKVLLVAAYLCLGTWEWIPTWLTVVVISRDFLIVGGLALLTFWGTDIRAEIKPTMISKVNTNAQIGLVFLLLAERSLSFYWSGLETVLIFTVGGLTFITGIHYVIRGVSLFHPHETPFS